MQNPHPSPNGLTEHKPEPVDAVKAGTAEPAPEAPVAGPETPLTEEQKADARKMVAVLNTDQRKAFTISFRSAFNVPRDAKTIAPLITERQHLEFVDRFTLELGGTPAP